MTFLSALDFSVFTVIGGLIIAIAAFARRSKDPLPDIVVAMLFANINWFLGIPFAALSRQLLHQPTADVALYRIDLALGLDPFRLMAIVYGTPWLKVLLMISYNALPAVMASAWAIDHSGRMLRGAVIAPIAALATYSLVPAVGPIHALSWATHGPLPLGAFDGVPRNCMPSLHFTWSLLVAINARNRFLKPFAYVFVILTALATVGSGEHYYCDLLAAVPFTFLIQYLAGFVPFWRPVPAKQMSAQ